MARPRIIDACAARSLVALAIVSHAPAQSAHRSPLDELRRHEQFASALARAVPLERVGDRYVTSNGVALDAHHAAIRVADAYGNALTVTSVDEAQAHAIEDRALVFSSSAPDTDVVEIATADAAEEFRVLRSKAAPTTFRYRLEREGIAAVRVESGRIAAVDAEGNARIVAAAPFAIDAHGTKRTLDVTINGDELIASLDTHDLAYPIVVDPEWKATASMAVRRQFAAAVRLASGKILVSGGIPSLDPVSSAEVYDEATAKWTAVAPMKAARAYHAAVLLTDGTVLVAGGAEGTAPTAEIYNPTTNVWTATTAMTGGHRLGAVAARLGDGRVLVNGGTGPTSTRDDVYNPVTKTWSATPLTDIRRMFHQATTLKDGRVLITGGRVSTAPNYPRRIDIYNPATSSYLNAAGLGFMVEGRKNHTATLLADGRVLVTGGSDDTTVKNSAEAYDPTANSWSTIAGTMVGRRSFHNAEPLESGEVLLMGGVTGPGPALQSCELFDPTTATFKPFAAMITGRVGFVSAVLPSGKVLVAGGTTTDIDSGYLSSAEIVAAFPAGKACAAASECMSGFCVDGVCCNSACTEQCQACDVPTKVGTCMPVDGEPHGSRPKCEAPAGEPCKARTCEGLKDVKFCASYVKGNSCADAKCDGEALIAAATCDGAGTCVAPAALPCAPYACSTNACTTTCSAKTDCASGYFCKDNKCVPEGASCSTDGKSSIGKDGKITPCGAFRCGGDGLCADRCVDSSVCADGYTCDTSTNQCVAVSGDTADEGGCGCSTPGGSGRSTAFVLAGLALALGVARRSRARV